MTLHLTPEILVQAYELLRATPPFKRWKLPHADEVEFRVTQSKDHSGSYQYAGKHIIRISALHHKQLPPLIVTLAHEMCHMHQHLTAPTDTAHHGWRFKKYAALACRHHGIVPETF